MKIGIGYDVHKLSIDRKLVLGGVLVPFDKGLLGHSDADVLIHAIMDSILGALGLSDIGCHFPDTDSQYKDASSILLLEKVYELMTKEGYKIGNVDTVIVCQQPKLKDYIEQMEKNIAKTLNTDVKTINVKATTEEYLGFTGRLEGISAKAVCLLEELK